MRSIFAALVFFSLNIAGFAQGKPMQKTYPSFDGHVITYTELGEGPIVFLLHGFTANAELNWFRTEIAKKIADAGYRVIAPDFRGHGKSQVPDTPTSWPRDALARDQIALMNQFGEEPHAIVGYSLGAITALRVHLLSRRGGRLVLGGVGDSVADEFNTDRNDAFRAAITDAIDGKPTPGARGMRARLAATGGTLEGYLGALGSRTYTPADLLVSFEISTLVLTGDEDLDNGSGEALAEIIPGARYDRLKGTHLTAVTDPAFADKIIAFLGE